MSDRRLFMPASCAQVVFRQLIDSQPVENVFYVKHQHNPGSSYSDANFDSGSADAVADDIATWINSTYKSFVSENWYATGLEIVWNTAVGSGPLNGNAYTGSPYPIAATGGNPALPNSVTVAVSLKTKLLGRAFHGRVYVCGIGKNSVDTSAPNSLTSAAASTLLSAWEALRSALFADHGTLGIFDRYVMQVGSFMHGGTERSPALMTDVDHFALSDTYLDSQRRRLPAHNRHR